MKRLCAWCGKFMGYCKGGEKGDITHGMCRKCYREQIKLLEGTNNGKRSGNYV